MKVVSAIAWRILVDTGSSADIITWDCLKKLKYSRRKIVSLVHPIVGFGGQEVYPTGMIHIPLRFADKAKARTLEVDFLVVDAPVSYRRHPRQPTLHKIKAVIAPYLLQLQLEASGGSVGIMQGDQWPARECYLVSICPLKEYKNQWPERKTKNSKPKPWGTTHRDLHHGYCTRAP
ncbi:hypothetical protein Cgig2_010024 [Carnegiea gigantea]|uniref:Peptidase A2 domain-containing protein n=1 Tax=Carnegiea gigantea TaxID=171969 RepID=A0A9Q1K341_9CARY|nr:hypothetical protein Cgig2_010024 [Carnegiea gigantea]